MVFALRDRTRMRAPVIAMMLTVAGLTTCCSSPSARPSFPEMAAVAQPAGMRTILGPRTGTGRGTLTFTVPRRFQVNFSCTGHGPVLIHATPPLATMTAICQGGRTVGGEGWKTPQRLIGATVSLRVAAPRGTTWDLRVDGSSP